MSFIATLHTNLFLINDDSYKGYVITSNETINKGDYYYLDTVTPGFPSGVHICKSTTSSKLQTNCDNCHKIIATIGFRIKGLPYGDIPTEGDIAALNRYPGDDDWPSNVISRELFAEGYNKAYDTFKYAEADLYAAFRAGLDACLKHRDWAFGISGLANNEFNSFMCSFNKVIRTIEIETNFDISDDAKVNYNTYLKIINSKLIILSHEV